MNESQLKRSYQALPLQSQRIVHVLALCESRVTLATLIAILKACGWADAATKSGFLTQTLLKRQLKEAVDRGFASRQDSAMTAVNIAQQVQDFVVQQAVLNGDFPLIVAAMKQQSDDLIKDICRLHPTDRKAHEARREARIAFYRGDVAAFKDAQQRLISIKPALGNLGLLDPFNANTVSPEEYTRLAEAMSSALAGNPTHLVPQRYSSAQTSGLEAEVVDGGDNTFTFELQD